MTEIQAEMVVAALPIWTILKVRSKAIVDVGVWYRRLVEFKVQYSPVVRSIFCGVLKIQIPSYSHPTYKET